MCLDGQRDTWMDRWNITRFIFQFVKRSGWFKLINWNESNSPTLTCLCTVYASEGIGEGLEKEDCVQALSGQIFMGMVSSQFQARLDTVRLIENLVGACIRFVYFSMEDELRSKVWHWWENTLCKNMMHLPCHILSSLNVGFACRCLQRRWVWRRAGTVTSLWPQTEMVTAMVLRPAQVKQDLYMMTLFMVSVSFCLPAH